MMNPQFLDGSGSGSGSNEEKEFRETRQKPRLWFGVGEGPYPYQCSPLRLERKEIKRTEWESEQGKGSEEETKHAFAKYDKRPEYVFPFFHMLLFMT